MLAAFTSIMHFRTMLEGSHFQLWTDHKPLLAALYHVSQPRTWRQQRQLSFIAECTGDVRHMAGIANMVADALSRPPTEPVCHVATHLQPEIPAQPETPFQLPAVDYTTMATAQLSCPGWPSCVQPAACSLSNVTRDVKGHLLEGDISTGVFRLLVPVPSKKLCLTIFTQFLIQVHRQPNF